VVAGVVLAGWNHRAGGDDRARHPMQPSVFVAGVVIAGLVVATAQGVMAATTE